MKPLYNTSYGPPPAEPFPPQFRNSTLNLIHFNGLGSRFIFLGEKSRATRLQVVTLTIIGINQFGYQFVYAMVCIIFLSLFNQRKMAIETSVIIFF